MHPGLTRRSCLSTALGLAGGCLLPAAAGAGEVQPWPRAERLPALDALDLQGQRWNFDKLGGRAVLLNFWASWCEPCRQEMPTLQQLVDVYGEDKLAVLALNFKESPAIATRFARNAAMTVPVLLDPGGQIAARFAVKIFPTTVGIGRDGRPRWRVRGEMDWSAAQALGLVDALLA
ncbi:TlpA family protein disulfide reductase [Caenimonas terrae]|uniref:TlpA family protein disulfide reductase n=1 Tax=Caenimonas terrae TaxID=696074 RepID=A0ABW0NGV8_9BURK